MPPGFDTSSQSRTSASQATQVANAPTRLTPPSTNSVDLRTPSRNLDVLWARLSGSSGNGKSACLFSCLFAHLLAGIEFGVGLKFGLVILFFKLKLFFFRSFMPVLICFFGAIFKSLIKIMRLSEFSDMVSKFV